MSHSAPIRLIPAWMLTALASLSLPATAAHLRSSVPDLPEPDYPVYPDHFGNTHGLFNENLFLTVGFSFMIGLAMGFALKLAFKIALIVISLTLLGIFGLQSMGLVDINWSGLEMHYDGWIAGLHALGETFFGFIGENVASVASFLAGLTLGLKY